MITETAANFTAHWAGYTALTIFVLGYAFVIAEDKLEMKKSKPMLVAASAIWVVIALAFMQLGDTHSAETAVRHYLLEYSELFLFLLAAMTYVNTIEERGVFDALRAWLVGRGFSYRMLFWVTGALAFVISPIADNMTTSLVMGTVAVAVGTGNPRFVTLSCINIVVAANAGGAFSPFGDITTLMVWQKGILDFGTFLALFFPALVNWLVPAFLMAWTIGPGHPDATETPVVIHRGAGVVVGLFLATIAMAVTFHAVLHLPPVLGMMAGLGVLKLYAWWLKFTDSPHRFVPNEADDIFADIAVADPSTSFDPFKQLERSEWDTLLFFYGVILAVGGLGTLGYLTLASGAMYGGMGPTAANVLVGFLSAIVDNIPVMFAVLAMHPDMSHGQWLLVTLTAGVGGSLLSIGSAAGVALMGQARGVYTFMAHLRWTWAIALGYAASIGTHFLINGHMF